jgi:hypothetical protein
MTRVKTSYQITGFTETTFSDETSRKAQHPRIHARVSFYCYRICRFALNLLLLVLYLHIISLNNTNNFQSSHNTALASKLLSWFRTVCIQHWFLVPSRNISKLDSTKDITTHLLLCLFHAIRHVCLAYLRKITACVQAWKQRKRRCFTQSA